MFQNKKGFTLIELMVVIAIIAILATVVLVALQGARDAAEDSKRQSAVTQVRSIAEIHYATNDQKYTGFADTADYIHLQNEITDPAITLSVADDNYCAMIELTADNKYFCISNREGPKAYTVGTGTGDVAAMTCGVSGDNQFRCVAP